MRVLHLCTYDHGGAANAAIRLHEGLLALGDESFFASKVKTRPGTNRTGTVHPWNRWFHQRSPAFEYHLARLLSPGVRPVFTRGFLPGCGLTAVKKLRPRIVHLHWVDHGMISLRNLRELADSKAPVVWTLHDMAPLTGGFGYREAMDLPPAAFGPLTLSGVQAGASQRLLDSRADSLRGANLTVVAPSKWLAEEARRSPVFSAHRVEHIPYGIDTTTFKPVPVHEARARWKLPLDHRVILFGADTFGDKRKGIAHLQAALAQLPREINGKPLLLVGFGNASELTPSDFPIPVRGIGRLTDLNEIAALYSAADVFVCPSREDNLPNTMVESLSCGTPVVGFQIGGLTDLVIPGQTGDLAPPYDETRLAQCIANILSAGDEEALAMRSNCRQNAESQLGLEIQAKRYQELYRDLIGLKK